MLRTFALAVCLIGACATPTFAQTPPTWHPRVHAHDPATHAPLDSAQHAALHALMHGDWIGSLSSANGASQIDLSIDHDSAHGPLFRLRADHRAVGGASHFALRGDTLHWTQIISGRTCTATALLGIDSQHVATTMRGRFACGDGGSTFDLHKKSK
jgi:hypothetical protein